MSSVKSKDLSWMMLSHLKDIIHNSFTECSPRWKWKRFTTFILPSPLLISQFLNFVELKQLGRNILTTFVKYPATRCPKDPTVRYHKVETPDLQRFSLKAFQFVGVDGPFVYIHCKVIVCNATDQNSHCAKNCVKNGLFSTPARRHKRAIDYSTPLYSTSFTQGPILNLDHGRAGKPVSISSRQFCNILYICFR